jgi:hypothetical protein
MPLRSSGGIREFLDTGTDIRRLWSVLWTSALGLAADAAAGLALARTARTR